MFIKTNTNIMVLRLETLRIIQALKTVAEF